MKAWEKIRDEFLNRPFETQAILVTAALAVFRVIIALVLDFLRPEIKIDEVAVDFCFLMLFIGLLWLAIRNTIRRVHPLFGYAFVLLLAVNFLQFGGIHGTSKFHFFSGIFITILFYSGRNLLAILVFQGVLMLFLIYVTLFDPAGFEFFAFPPEVIPADFMFTLVTLGALAFYLKAITAKELERHGYLNLELRKKVSQAMAVNGALINEADQLKQVQKELEIEVAKRTKSLKEQNESIESYIHMNTKVLHDPIMQLGKLVSELPLTQHELHGLLLRTSDELNDIFTTIKSTLDKEEDLDRNKLRTS